MIYLTIFEREFYVTFKDGDFTKIKEKR